VNGFKAANACSSKMVTGENTEDAHLPTSVKVDSKPEVQSQAQDKSIFDMVTLLDRLMGNEELATAVLNGFLDDMPHQIEALARFVESGNARGVEEQAHRIKGAAATVSGMALRELASKMELAGKAADLVTAKASLGKLGEQFGLLRDEIARRQK
jgi:HPt (histidine-containing phosphotransfer) domain-containing protein